MEVQMRHQTSFTSIKPVIDRYMANVLRSWRLEPDDAKVSSPVLRGGERGDSLTSPDKRNNLLAIHESCHDYIHMSKSES